MGQTPRHDQQHAQRVEDRDEIDRAGRAGGVDESAATVVEEEHETGRLQHRDADRQVAGPLSDLALPDGALGLEERLPDCWLGRQRDLMAALFPPMTSDVLTFYLPV